MVGCEIQFVERDTDRYLSPCRNHEQLRTFIRATKITLDSTAYNMSILSFTKLPECMRIDVQIIIRALLDLSERHSMAYCSNSRWWEGRTVIVNLLHTVSDTG